MTLAIDDIPRTDWFPGDTKPTRVDENTPRTDWFPNSVKPVREGVYQLDEPWFLNGVFAYWNGRRFGYRTVDPAAAYRWKDAATGLSPRATWRGLAQDPSI